MNKKAQDTVLNILFIFTALIVLSRTSSSFADEYYILDNYTPPEMFSDTPVKESKRTPKPVQFQSEPFTPPLPPKRPTTLHASENYLKKQILHLKIKDMPRRNNIPDELENDALTNELIEMNASDVLENIDED